MAGDRRDGVVDALGGLRNLLGRADRVIARRVDTVHDPRVLKEGIEDAGGVHGRLGRPAQVERGGGPRVEVRQVVHGGEPDLTRRLGGDGHAVARQVDRGLPRRQWQALARFARRRVDDGDRVALGVDQQNVRAVLDDVDRAPGGGNDRVQAVDLGVGPADRLLGVTGDPDGCVAEVHPLRAVAARHDGHRRHEGDDRRTAGRRSDERLVRCEPLPDHGPSDRSTHFCALGWPVRPSRLTVTVTQTREPGFASTRNSVPRWMLGGESPTATW